MLRIVSIICRTVNILKSISKKWDQTNNKTWIDSHVVKFFPDNRNFEFRKIGAKVLLFATYFKSI